MVNVDDSESSNFWDCVKSVFCVKLNPKQFYDIFQIRQLDYLSVSFLLMLLRTTKVMVRRHCIFCWLIVTKVSRKHFANFVISEMQTIPN